MTGARVLGLVDREWPALTTPPEAQEPIRAELFSVERLEQHAESLAAAQHVTADPRSGTPLAPRVARQRPRAARSRTARSRRRSARNGRSRRRRSGWSTTSTSSTSSSGRSATTCPPASTASCRSSPTGSSPAIRASSASRGRSSRTPTAASIPRSCAASSRLPARRSRCASASCGRSRSRCASCWSRICGVSRSASSSDARTAARRRARRRGCSASAGGRRRRDHRAGPPRRGPLPSGFAVQLVQRLREQDPTTVPALRWLDERLAAPGHDHRRDRAPRAPGPGRDERHGAQRHHQHAPDVGARLEGVLRERQPGRRGAAARQPASRRWTSRRAIATATRSRTWRAAPSQTELEVARRAVEKAASAPSRPADDPQRGSRLLPDLRADAPRSSTSSASVRACDAGSCARTSPRAPPAYLGTIALLTALVLAVPLVARAHAGASTPWLLLFGLLALVPATDLAIALANRGVIERIGPRRCRSSRCATACRPSCARWSWSRRC